MKGVLDSMSVLKDCEAKDTLMDVVKDCFDNNDSGHDNYRPLFWYLDKDKRQYEEHFGVTHSDCYLTYGLKRTGCAGCPYGRDFENELRIIQEHEPKLFVAVNNIFGKAYEYTRQYRDFCKEQDKCKKNMNK
jgi:hypothetical protein